MAKIYAALIRKGIKTLDEVPARLRSTVEALLAANGISAVSEQDEETDLYHFEGEEYESDYEILETLLERKIATL